MLTEYPAFRTVGGMDRPLRFEQRVAMHAALGEPVRLAIVDDLVVSDRTPKELGARHSLPTNLLAHHLHVLEQAGLVSRSVSAGDARRRYVRLTPAALPLVGRPFAAPPGPMLFLCTRNSARSQLAAAVWTARTGLTATSAGTEPAPRVHRGAVAAARRAGLDLGHVVPRRVEHVAAGTQVVTVCDLVHEELRPEPDWWHWSITDPVDEGSAAAFDAVVADLNMRIDALVPSSERSIS